MYSSMSPNFPKNNNLKKRDIEKINNAYSNFIESINNIPDAAKDCIEMLIFGDDTIGRWYGEEAVRLNLVSTADNFCFDKMLRKILEQTEYLVSIINTLREQHTDGNQVDEVASHTCLMLQVVYSNLTGDNEVKRNGALEKYMVAAIEPVNKHKSQYPATWIRKYQTFNRKSYTENCCGNN